MSSNAGATWAWERYVRGFSGLSAIQATDGLVMLQLANLHGDVVATVPNSTPSSASSAGSVIATYQESTEYGAARSAAPVRYGWLGTAQRSADMVGSIVSMGARLYNPVSGLFLSADPVPGGGANAYAYPTNPLNMSDLDGQSWKSWVFDGAAAFIAGRVIALGCLGAGVLVLVCNLVFGFIVGFIFSVVRQMWVEGKSFGGVNWGVAAYAGFVGALGALGGASFTTVAKKFGLLYRITQYAYRALSFLLGQIGRLPRAVRLFVLYFSAAAVTSGIRALRARS